jgi:HSP20 family protein
MLWPISRNRGWWNWDPWSDLRQIQREMNRMFEGAGRRGRTDMPALNVWRKQDGTVVTAELPGVDPKGLDISVQGNTLVLRGSREPDEVQEGETYHRQERGYGQFVRSLRLPHQVDAGKVEATYRKGILRVTLPMAEADKPKQITVASA